MTKSLYRSFAGGEITPEMYGRVDLAKFQTGLQKCLNFVTLPHGPAARRPGLRFLGYDGTSSNPAAVRLMPYVASTGQSFMLVFTPGKFIAYYGGAALLEAAKTITAQTAGPPRGFTITGHGWATGEIVYQGGRAYVLQVVDANTVQLRHPTTGAFSSTVPASMVGTTLARVKSTAVSLTAADLPLMRTAQNGTVLTVTTGTTPAFEIRADGSGGWTVTAANFTTTQPAPTSPVATPTTPNATNLTTQRYVVTALGADLVTESLASASASATNNLALAGNFNTITWTAAAGAARYYVYKIRGGVFGFIGQTTGTSLIDDNILPDTLVSPPENIITLNSVANEYPRAVTHYERRRWFAGTTTDPQSVWATRNGTESNLTSSVPSRDDDGLEFRIAAQQLNQIEHLVPLTDMIALTNGAEFRIFADGGPAITPSTISIKPQGFSGASPVQPALTERTALYVQAQGSRIRELGYDPNGTGAYRTTDVSLIAPHLFNGYGVTQLAYTRAPEAVLWAVRSDGAMLGMSYVPDQQVYGWHQHTTPGGSVVSVAVIPEAGEDVLYVAVRRTLAGGGGGQRVFIERLSTRVFSAQSDAFFVDSGLTYRGAPVTTLTGLDHLEGQTVAIFADGSVESSQVVTAGAITLSRAAAVISVGLGYVSDLVTLPLAYEGAPAAGQAVRKNVNTVFLRVAQSSAAKAGPNTAELREYPARQVSDPWDSPPALRTAELDIAIDPSWNSDGSVCVRQDLPLPLTVVSMSLDTATGG